ncbi:MAG: 23S rRNA pseudouridine(955/2504/2580) synthase RluC [Candidatus Dasytiphilus stammeri]
MNRKRRRLSSNWNEIFINSEDTGRRLDNFLRSTLKDLSKNLFYKLIRKGSIRVNKRLVQPSYRLKTCDLLSIPLLTSLKKKEKDKYYPLKTIELISKKILYDDDYILAINKPSGIAVHGGSGLSYGLIEILRLWKKNNPFLELVHRLDRETSGILLVAKKKSVLRSLHEQFRLQIIKKIYFTLVDGLWPSHLKTIAVPLQRSRSRTNSRLVRINPEGKFSKTLFKIQEHFSQATLLKVMPITGRTHQIRVHTQYVGHPIALDKLYGNSKFNNQLIEMGLNRLFLHASSIIFIHPHTNQEICITAPLHEELSKILSFLRSKK